MNRMPGQNEPSPRREGVPPGVNGKRVTLVNPRRGRKRITPGERRETSETRGLRICSKNGRPERSEGNGSRCNDPSFFLNTIMLTIEIEDPKDRSRKMDRHAPLTGGN